MEIRELGSASVSKVWRARTGVERRFTAQFRHYRSEGVVEGAILSGDRDGKVNLPESDTIVSWKCWRSLGDVQESREKKSRTKT